MWTRAAFALLLALGVVDLAIFARARRVCEGRLGWLLFVMPLGGLAFVVAASQGWFPIAGIEGPMDLESMLWPLLLPVFACLSGFAFLGACFASEGRQGRLNFALHTAASVLLGVLATLALVGLELPRTR